MAPHALFDVTSVLKQSNDGRSDHRPSPTPLLNSSLPLNGPSSSRSSHHSVTSHGSSRSSLYLSPPVTDSETEDAPYKPKADDNNSLNMHVKWKRRKKAMHHRKDQPAALEHADQPFEQLAFAINNPRRSSAIRSSRSYSSLSDTSGCYGPMEIGQNTTPNVTVRSNSENCGKTDNFISIDKLNGRLLTNAHERNTDNSQERRTVRTERLRPGTASDSIRRWSIVADGVILSPSAATACAADVNGNNSFPWAHVTVDDSARKKDKNTMASVVDNDAYWKNNSRHISTSAFTAETPATITLRKASNVYHHENSRRLSQSEKVRRSKRRTVKDGKPMGFLPGERPARAPQADSTIASTHDNEQNEVFAVSLVSPRSCTLLSTSTSSSDQLTLRRRTVAADPALTFAEVHTTPEVFSRGRSSRKHSQLAIDTMRRSSTVMIWSGSSIHEIIWDKDDSPSSSSSRRSLSQMGSGSSSERRSPDGSPRKTSMDHNRFQNLDFSKPASRDAEVSTNPSGAKEFQEVADRSWTREEPAGNPEDVIERTAIEEGLHNETLSCTASKRDGRWSKSWRANISNSMQGVESFPPLLERGSTYEWRKFPPVDIDDPAAGQNVQSASKTSIIGNTNPGTTNEVQERQTSPSSSKPSSTAHHGTWTHGHLGTALGTSSHHRRPSIGPHQQGPYSSLIDLSKSVSRRASQITHSLSDKAIDWAADHHAPPPHRRTSKSKSADSLSDALVPDNKESSTRSILQASHAAQRLVPAWHKSNGGLWINTASARPESRALRAAGLSEVAEDEVEDGAERELGT
ncbi:hypothetical protein MMC26_004928 [Xylographa opegraphella]|nr:hypothetical protein [Xylographa opegraphella]